MASDATGGKVEREPDLENEASSGPLDRLPPWALGIGFIIVMGLLAAVVILRLTEDFDRSQKDAYNTVLAVLLGVVGTAFGVGIQSGKVKSAERDKKRAQKNRARAESEREDAKVRAEKARTEKANAKARVMRAVAETRKAGGQRGIVQAEGGADVSELLAEIEAAFEEPRQE